MKAAAAQLDVMPRELTQGIRMQQLFDLIDAEFTDAEIREIASELEARVEALLVGPFFVPFVVAAGVGVVLWSTWRAL